MSCTGPVNGRFGLCRTSLDLGSEFDTEELECGGDGVKVEVEVEAEVEIKAEGGCNMVVEEVEMGNGGYRSTVVGSDGVWKVIRPVP